MADPTDISLLLFDLNGVLYRYDRAARITWLQSVSKQPPDLIRSKIWESGFEDSGDSGMLDAESYLRGFGERIGASLTEADWIAAHRKSVSPILPTFALLRRVRPGVRCAVLTNNNLLVRRHFSTLYPEIAAIVGDRAYVSAEFAARKPEPEVYRRCLAQLGVSPEAALFVDDSKANAEGAFEAGLHAHHYTNPESLAAALLGSGVLD